jgi:hypothetical protein
MSNPRLRPARLSAPRLLAFAALVLALGLASGAVASESEPVAARDGRCLTAMARELPLAPGTPPGLDPRSTAIGPPPNPQVGDEWLWYIWRLNGFPMADLKLCTVRGMGDHCYVVVENSQWNVNIDQADVNHIVDQFDHHSIGPYPNLGIHDINVATFGEPPDRLDNDPRIYLLYYDFDVNADGYFWPFDEFPDGSQAFSSNECEVLYLNDSDFDPAGDYMVAVAAHEFEHMIHFEYDEDEAPWVDEGLAELAMWLYGHPDQISQFNTAPDNNLTVWNSAWADYIQTYLWSLYFYERYGGAAAAFKVVHEPANSTLGYDNVLDQLGYTANFDDVFADWTVANYLDNPAVGDGRFGYVGETLPAFSHSASHASYPVGPVNATVNHWASDYVQFTTPPVGLTLGFDGDNSTRYACWALELDPSQLPRVTRVSLDAAQAGTIGLPDVGSLYARAVLVSAGISAAGGTSYAYTGSAPVTGVAAAGSAPGSAARLLGAAPNPFGFETEVRLDLAHTQSVRLMVVDAQGRICRTLHDGALPAGISAIPWDGRDGAARELANGVYFFRLEADDQRVAGRVLIAR